MKTIDSAKTRSVFAAKAIVTALLCGAAGCGGGGGSTTASTASTAASTTAPTLETKSMGTTADTNLNTASTQSTATDPVEGAALSSGALNDVATTDTLLTTTGTYLSAASAESKAASTRVAAAYSKVVDGVTATLSVTPVSLTSADFTVTLNGTPTGTSTTYTNFVFATGVATRGTNGAETGTHYTATYDYLVSGATEPLATSDTWIYNDGSTSGSVTYTTTGTTVIWLSTTADVWTWTLYQNGNAATGVLRGKVVVNADRSGTASLYCAADGQLRSQATWTGTGSGQFCRYVTACTPNGDHPCVSYGAL